MTKYNNDYTMQADNLERIRKSRGLEDGEDLICAHRNCDDPILEGDEVHSTQGRSKRRIYHKACWFGSFQG